MLEIFGGGLKSDNGIICCISGPYGCAVELIFHELCVFIEQGWVHKAENVKTLKLILRFLSSTVVNNKDNFLWECDSKPFTREIDGVLIADFKKETYVIEYILDTLYLLLQASW